MYKKEIFLSQEYSGFICRKVPNNCIPDGCINVNRFDEWQRDVCFKYDAHNGTSIS
jgi:hypothetical protein